MRYLNEINWARGIPGLFIGLLAAIILISTPAESQNRTQQNSKNSLERTILVTAVPHDERTAAAAERLQPSDFAVFENKRPQKITSVRRAAEEPLIIAILVQDDLIGRVNNELNGIKEFIRGLPAGSRVMVGYVTSGSLQVRQEFTADRELAANSFRVLASTSAASPFNPFVEVTEALERFDSQPAGRRMILLVSDGLDVSHGPLNGSPFFSMDLDRSIAEAQRRSVAVFTIYAPSVGITRVSRHAVNYGQGSLLRLAGETGGESFFSGSDFVSFEPYFRDYKELLGDQWLITYESSSTGKGFRRVQVTTDFDLHLHYLAGYNLK